MCKAEFERSRSREQHLSEVLEEEFETHEGVGYRILGLLRPHQRETIAF